MYLVELSDSRNTILYEKLKKLHDTQSYTGEKNLTDKDACVIFSPAKKLSGKDAERLPIKARVFGGNQASAVLEIFKAREIKYVNLLSDETFSIKNAVLTAECCFRVLIDATEKSVFENNILILGCGRLGKALSLLFSKLGLSFAVCTYNKAEFEAAVLYAKRNFFSESYISVIEQFDVIINTIPAIILNDDVISKISKDTSIIELASIPCLDTEKIKYLDINYMPTPGLPSLYCPETAADIMLESILQHI